jgi:hypothetical protein
MTIAWFTSATINYLDRAAILAKSMKEVHPDWVSYLLLVDHKIGEAHKNLHQNYDFILYPEEVIREDLAKWNKFRERDTSVVDVYSWLNKHTITEACTAVKPFAMEYLAEANDFVFYLDPDLVVFSSMNNVLAPLVNGASVILTPHQLEPETELQAIIDNEIGTLRTGLYNFGFLGVNASHEHGLKFINFWKERLKYFCLEDPTLGLHTDQKWGNFVPLYFQDVYIINNPGLNVASWNLSKRIFSINEDGEYLVNNEPLIFYHFSQAKGTGLGMANRYANGNLLIADIWRWYLETLEFYEKFVPENKWKYGVNS